MGLQVTTPVNQHAVPALRPCSVIVTVCVSRACNGDFCFCLFRDALASASTGWACYLARLRLASYYRWVSGDSPPLLL